MKVSIQFTANLVLENIELSEEKTAEIMSYYEENGTLSDEMVEMVMNDPTADLFVEEVISIDDIFESLEDDDDDDEDDDDEDDEDEEDDDEDK
jgi:hypothetical protein